MKHFSTLRASVYVVALGFASNAYADVTAKEVWTNFKDQLSSNGASQLTMAAEEMSGNTLTVRDIVLNSNDPNMTATAQLGTLVFVENGDGTVTAILPNQMVLDFNDSSVPDGAHFTINVDISGASMLVSGTPDDMHYDSTADRYTISIADAMKAGERVPVELQININNVSSSQNVVKGGDITHFAGTSNASALDYFFSGEDATSQFSISGQTTGVAVSAEVDLPVDMNPTNADRAFLNGMSIGLDFSSATSAVLTTVIDDTGTTTITTSNTSGSGAFSMSKDALSLAAGASNVAVSVTSGAIPFPIEAGMAAYAVNVTAPLSQTEAPADFAVGINVTELTLNDNIWMMADPMGAMPHDPITAQIDTTGTLTLFHDITDPAQAEALASAGAPGELNSLSLNSILLSALGASVTGDGAFTFDNTDLTSFDGMPRPEGSLSLDAVGLNGLIDGLASMGLMPEDQLAGMRMMLGMFATVVGDDHVTSKLEINGAGNVIVNGQRIK